jgi:hypothetical protein
MWCAKTAIMSTRKLAAVGGGPRHLQISRDGNVHQ